MTRILGLLIPVLLLTTTGWALPEPELGSFTDAQLEEARRHDAATPLAPHGAFERTTDPVAEQEAEEHARLQQRNLLLNDDNDITHYARGSTLIMNIWVSHTNGTWTSTDRDIMAARHGVAKANYLDAAPPQANLHFDHEGTNYYWSYNVTLPYPIYDDGFIWDDTEEALSILGFTDGDGDGQIIDDFNLFLQSWNGGWDNVISSFQPAEVTGRAFANSPWSRVMQYTDDNATTRAHEWGHMFGACDEYSEGGHCYGGLDCGPCQGQYLLTPADNGNCELLACPTNVPCLMHSANLPSLCDYTHGSFGWDDSDDNGQLDRVRRRVSGSTFVDIWELWENGAMVWNNTGNGMVAHQKTATWSAVGLRSPSTADYNLAMYADNNHNFLLAASNYVGDSVDFVVGDFNHNRLGNEHFAVQRVAGNTANYRLTYESGQEMLYPDGVDRAGYWSAGSVVRIWDVPLFAGETITFDLDVTSGSLDLGMALFRSTGEYWASRSAAQWTRDTNGAGVGESYTYTVPADDVYGLLVFSNDEVSGDFAIQIGPTPATLAEETPFHSSWALRLFNYDPNAWSWSFVGNRPSDGGAATATSVELFNDPTYETRLEISDDYNSGGAGNLDFIAADYNHVNGAPEYVRVNRTSGTGSHRTEWEHDDNMLTGATPTSMWNSGHVGKVWDVEVEAGTSYFAREYHLTDTPLDTGLYLFTSGGGDYIKPRAEYSAAANFRAPSAGGEWFSWTASTTDWAGLYLITNDESSGFYSVWFGPKRTFTNDSRSIQSDEIIWGTAAVTAGYWHAFGVRPEPGDAADVWLYGDSAYSSDNLRVSDTTGDGVVNFVVADYNHTPVGTVYPRFRRSLGLGGMDIEFEGGTESLAWVGGAPTGAFYTWPGGDVVEAIDVYLEAGTPVVIQTEMSSTLDLGLAVFQSSGGTYYASPADAVVSADAGGLGVSEQVSFTPTATDYYGLVIWSSNDATGSVAIAIGGQGTASPGPLDAVTELTLASSPNPFRERANVAFALPAEERVRIDVFDVSGRLVRTLADDVLPAGRHARAWDGRDTGGSLAGAGVYFLRLHAGGETRTRKVVRMQD